MNNIKETIKALKCALYGKLLEKSSSLWTDTEIEITYQLALDKDIQDVLEKAWIKGINNG